MFKFRKMKTQTILIVALAVILIAIGSYYLGTSQTKQQTASVVTLGSENSVLPVDEKKKIRNNWTSYFKIQSFDPKPQSGWGFGKSEIVFKNLTGYKLDQ